MKVAFITRTTLYTFPGGDTIQVIQTARTLRNAGVTVDIWLANEQINYAAYDLHHFFNITRPADILSHNTRITTPFIVSPILVDYSQYDQHHRTGITGILFRLLSAHTIEYLKTIARWLSGTDKCIPFAYLRKGQQKSIREIIGKTAMLLPNSQKEKEQLTCYTRNFTPAIVVPNGIDPELFIYKEGISKDDNLVLCVARIEGLKNQYNLIKALNNTLYRLIIIGSPAPNQHTFYRKCRKLAASNITFISHLPQKELLYYYQKAKVHVLPSWFETCGLSSLEAGAMGCNIVITDKGYTREYFEDYAFYCNPGSPESIRQAIEKAAHAPFTHHLRNKILHNYTWQKAAEATLSAYKEVLQV